MFAISERSQLANVFKLLRTPLVSVQKIIGDLESKASLANAYDY